MTLYLDAETMQTLRRKSDKGSAEHMAVAILQEWARRTGIRKHPDRPAGWAVEPEEYLGVDGQDRHYWLLKGGVYRTTSTTEPRLCSTVHLGTSEYFEKSIREREGVQA